MADRQQPDMMTALLASNILGGEQQHEQITYNVHTQVAVQLAQFAALMGAILALLGGFWLLGGGLWWVVKQAATSDLFFLAVVVAVLMSVFRAILRPLGQAAGLPRRLLTSIVEVIASLALVFLAFHVVHLVEHWNLINALRLAGGLALVCGSPLLIWRFANELWNPLFPKSPIIGVLESIIDRFAGTPQTVEVLKPYPIRMNGQVQAADVVQHARHAQQDDDEDDAPAVHHQVDGDFLDLGAFVQLAIRDGLSREALVVKPRHTLPSGQKLTRGRYDALVALAADPWGILDPGGGGMATSWIMEPGAALQMLRAVLAQMQGTARGDE